MRSNHKFQLQGSPRLEYLWNKVVVSPIAYDRKGMINLLVPTALFLEERELEKPPAILAWLVLHSHMFQCSQGHCSFGGFLEEFLAQLFSFRERVFGIDLWVFFSFGGCTKILLFRLRGRMSPTPTAKIRARYRECSKSTSLGKKEKNFHHCLFTF